MTRRKRTPSPSAAQKRVAFEIPASLQHFSSISRSLATNTAADKPGTPGHLGTLNNSHTFSPQYPTLATASHPSPQPINHTQKPKPPSQKPSSIGSRPWTNHSAAKPATARPASTNSRSSATPASRTISGPLSTSGHATSTPTQRRASSNPTVNPSAAKEPELKAGEAPTLKTHPNLIAALIAAKRAENEAIGNRKRWAIQQSEYQATKSPSTQPSNDSPFDHLHGSPAQPQQRAISNPLPTRPTITTANVRRTTQQTTPKPSMTSASQMPGSQTITPNTHGVEATVPVFDSPFSTPIAEFLERVTDEVGLIKDASDLNDLSSSAHMGTVKSKPPPASRSNSKQAQPQVGIPPLFSDRPNVQTSPQGTRLPHQVHQPFQQNPTSSTMPQYRQVTAPVMQSMSLPQTTTAVQTPTSIRHPQPGAQPYPNNVQLQQHQPQAQPYYPLTQGQQGFHKIDLRPQFNLNRMQQPVNRRISQGASPSFDSSPTTMNSPHMMQTQIISSTHSQLPNLVPYPPQRMASAPRRAMVYPPPEPIPTYGNPVVKPVTMPPPASAGLPSGFMTAADMVAGINTRFKIATPNGFSVPKRH